MRTFPEAHIKQLVIGSLKLFSSRDVVDEQRGIRFLQTHKLLMVLAENRQFHKFIILTIMLLF